MVVVALLGPAQPERGVYLTLIAAVQIAAVLNPILISIAQSHPPKQLFPFSSYALLILYGLSYARELCHPD